MSKPKAKISIFIAISLALFAKLNLALAKPEIAPIEPPTSINRNNQMALSIPVDTWNPFQQGINTFLQLDSAMTKQFFGNQQMHFNYFRLQEDPKRFLISLDLPGVDPNKIRVSISRGVLFVQAKDINDNQSQHNQSNAFYFSYHVALPENANTQKMSAILKRGILQITIEKTNKLASMIDIPVKEIA